jgi:hypothetical protein
VGIGWRRIEGFLGRREEGRREEGRKKDKRGRRKGGKGKEKEKERG